LSIPFGGCFYFEENQRGVFARKNAEISIIPHAALFVKRKIAQSSRRKDPEISAKLPLDFFKKFCYNYYTR